MIPVNDKIKNVNGLIVMANVLAIIGYVISGLLLLLAIISTSSVFNSGVYVLIFIIWSILTLFGSILISLHLKNKAYILDTLINIDQKS